MKDFDLELKKHLQKCELKFRAEMLPDGSNVEWLAPYCDDVQNIAQFLRSIGFKISDIVDDELVPISDFDEDGNALTAGENIRWVETTGGVLVQVNEGDKQGYVRRVGTRIVKTFQIHI